MNRVIKFRIWDLRAKIFTDVFSADFAFEMVRKFTGKENNFLDKYVFQQFTGLKDKNNIEVYEGDILLIPDEWTEPILDDGSGPRETFNHLSEVVYDEKLGSFGAQVKENGDYVKKGFYSFLEMFGDIGYEKLEVLGNIFENPELLHE